MLYWSVSPYTAIYGKRFESQDTKDAESGTFSSYPIAHSNRIARSLPQFWQNAGRDTRKIRMFASSLKAPYRLEGRSNIIAPPTVSDEHFRFNASP
jgi:hypothetical protein